MYRGIIVLQSVSVRYVSCHNCTAVCQCGVNRINTVLQWVSVGYYRIIIIMQWVSVGCCRVIIIMQWVSVGCCRVIIILQSVSVRYVDGYYCTAVYQCGI